MLRSGLVGAKPATSPFWPRQEDLQIAKQNSSRGHPEFVLSFAVLLVGNREQLGCKYRFLGFWGGDEMVKWHLHTGRCLLQWGALLAFRLRLLYASKKILNIPDVQVLPLQPELHLLLFLARLKLQGFR